MLSLYPNFRIPVRRVTVPQARVSREGATRHRQSTPPKDLERHASRFAQFPMNGGRS
jgi:hypothetical protein